MLSVNNIVVHYGGVKALKGVSLEAKEGTITCLIGANGAGKSTTLRAISGIVPISSGEIIFQGRRIDGLDPEDIVEMGIGHVPEGKKLFLEMSVRDNLLTGAYLRRDKSNIEDDLLRICQYFPVLDRAFYRPAAQMSGGEQQMLAIGRGLMSSPRLLLLDEPSLGLSPILTREVGAIIKRIAEEGVTILLIEQNASLALQLATSCYVLETGRVVIQGTSAELQNNQKVKTAYLGLDASAADSPAAIVPDQRPEMIAASQPEAYQTTFQAAGREVSGSQRSWREPYQPALNLGRLPPWPDWNIKRPSKKEEKMPLKDLETSRAMTEKPTLTDASDRPLVKKMFKPKVG